MSTDTSTDSTRHGYGQVVNIGDQPRTCDTYAEASDLLDRHITDANAAASAVPVEDHTAYRFVTHHRPTGEGCPWSHVSVAAPQDRFTPGNTMCPDKCPNSDVEPDPAEAGAR